MSGVILAKRERGGVLARVLPQTAISLIGLASLVGGVRPLSAQAPSSAQTHSTAQMDTSKGWYKHIGDDAARARCNSVVAYLLPIPVYNITRCKGRPADPLFESDRDEKKIIKKLIDSQWEKPSPWTKRKTVDGAYAEHSVSAIKNPHRISLREVSNSGMFVARIEVKAGSHEDIRYGIDAKNSRFNKVFYLAISQFDAIDTAQLDKASRRVSHWYIFEVQGEKLVRVGNTGSLRWCAMPTKPESDKDPFGAYTNCHLVAVAHELQRDPAARKLLEDSPYAAQLRRDTLKVGGDTAQLARAQLRELTKSVGFTIRAARSLPETIAPTIAPPLLQKITFLKREPGEELLPIWITCGGGCCTADDI